MWRERQPLASLPVPLPSSGTGGEARRHAFNWFVGVTVVFAVIVIAVTWLLAVWGWKDDRVYKSLFPVPLLAGLMVGGMKLVEYTIDERLERYPEKKVKSKPHSGPGAGDIRPGTLLEGVDGVMHRIETELSREEVRIVKTFLLSAGAYSVRALHPFLGDRASALRPQLHKQLGIIEKPKSRAVTKLTASGRKAVERW